MNKTAVTLGFLALVLVGLTGAIIVTILRPDAIGSLVSIIVTVLGLASTGIVTFYALGKQGETIDQIKTQTNGNTSRMLAQIEELQALLAQSAALPAPRPAATLYAVAPEPAASYAAGSGESGGRHS